MDELDPVSEAAVGKIVSALITFSAEDQNKIRARAQETLDKYTAGSASTKKVEKVETKKK